MMKEIIECVPDIVVLCVLGILSVSTRGFLPQFNRLFLLNDPDISLIHYEGDIVSSSNLALISVVFPAVFMILLSVIWRMSVLCSSGRKSKPIFSTLLKFAIGFALAHLLNKLITTVVKTQVGRLRPDFLARCLPSITNTTLPSTFYDASICTGDLSTIAEGRVSFPSGHSSTVFVGLGFLALTLFTLLQPRLFTIKNSTISTGNAIRFSIFSSLFLGASYVAISRVQQNVHNPTDVIAGALLGSTIALFVWWVYIKNPFTLEVEFKSKKLFEESVIKRFDRLEIMVVGESSASPLLTNERGVEEHRLIVLS